MFVTYNIDNFTRSKIAARRKVVGASDFVKYLDLIFYVLIHKYRLPSGLLYHPYRNRPTDFFRCHTNFYDLLPALTRNSANADKPRDALV